MNSSTIVTSCLALPCVLFIAGCGNGNTNTTPQTVPADAQVGSPDVPDASASVSMPSSSASSATPIASAQPDPPPDDSMCAGADVDLAAVLGNRKCRTRRDAPASPPNLPSLLKVAVTPSSDKVAPGGHVDLALEITNTSQSAVPLYFSGDLTLAPLVNDAKGARVSPPNGDAPKNADPKCASQMECKLPTSHVVLAPGGKARARIGWDANKVEWPKSGPTTCCTVHVDPVAAGPLSAGTYKVKVPLPYESNQGNPPDPEITIKVAKK
jgi:hypothetical protein